MLPPEPGLLSTMNCWANCSDSDCAISRARMSIAWPAAKPTTRRTGCAGQVCAPARRVIAGDTATPAARRWNMRRFILLLYHLVGAGQHGGREGEAERPGGLLVDDELELGRLLDRQLCRLGALQDACDVGRRAAVHVGEVRAVGHQAAVAHDVG